MRGTKVGLALISALILPAVPAMGLLVFSAGTHPSVAGMKALIDSAKRIEITRTDTELAQFAPEVARLADWRFTASPANPPADGDMDIDGDLDLDDVDDFVLGLVSEGDYVAMYGVDPEVHGDYNADCMFDLDDIPLFLEDLTNNPN